MTALFVGHGNPMNALDPQNIFNQGFQQITATFENPTALFNEYLRKGGFPMVHTADYETETDFTPRERGAAGIRRRSGGEVEIIQAVEFPQYFANEKTHQNSTAFTLKRRA
ncbi:hypothetical protein [Actinobacillus porcinus]|uniref:hypothetical protein n=1 Tax=Actinobacillus porcinus TaxID=51048 RepID=UPI002352616F|nr:hypothetical protein [Actinobacillus porcinus]